MARCGNKSCKKKYDASGRSSSFDNWCSDTCKAEIIAQKFSKLNNKPLKSVKLGGNKPRQYSSFANKSPSVKQSTFTTKPRKPLKNKCSLKGPAIGSQESKEKKKAKAIKLKIKRETSTLVLFETETTLNAVKARAKTICHLYIRTRDFGKPCICCGRELGIDYQAGHFQESGNNSAIRLDESNIHGQRADCNLTRGGDSGNYEPNLRLRIGDAGVDRLIRIAESKVVTKMTIDDYLKIIKYYKNKLDALISNQTFEMAIA